MDDRLTKVRIGGLRCLKDVTLPLHGLHVLVGENGRGKSSLIEAMELLRRLAFPQFVTEIHGVHGGAPQLLRAGARELFLAVEADGPEGPLHYSLALQKNGDALQVGSETLDLGPDGTEKLHVIQRSPGSARVFDQTQRRLVDVQPGSGVHLLGAFGMLPPQRAIERLVALLKRIDVHVGFDTTPQWVTRATADRGSRLRETIVVAPVDKGLVLRGANLSNAWMSLRNDFDEAHQQETMDLVRLGLGPEVEGVSVRVDPGGGSIGLRLKLRGLDEQIPAYSLSEGTLAYLAFVALYRLSDSASLIAFDEPETHLHPMLLQRVLEMFEGLAEERPVLLATHSDRLLDGLSDPAASAVLCELDEEHATQLRFPDAEALRGWLEEYRGIGTLRAEGYERQVFASKAMP